MAIVSVGIDMAKNVFAVYGVDESRKPPLTRPSRQAARTYRRAAAVPHRHGSMLRCPPLGTRVSEVRLRISAHRGRHFRLRVETTYIRAVQDLLGHSEVSTNMIDEHVLKAAAGGTESPLAGLAFEP